MSQVIIGSFETVGIPSLNVRGIAAKVDTGAWSGALHCTDIREENERLFFTPLGRPELATSTTDYEVRNVRSSNGTDEDRYRIALDIIIRGEPYRATITLSDRSAMQYDMLIGRKFLRKHHMLVDVRIGADKDEDEKEES